MYSQTRSQFIVASHTTTTSSSEDETRNLEDIVDIDDTYVGVLNWPAALAISVIATLAASVLHNLINRGYQGSVKRTGRTTTYTFGPTNLQDQRPENAPKDVPKKVVNDWNAAVATVAQYNPVNEGVKRAK